MRYIEWVSLMMLVSDLYNNNMLMPSRRILLSPWHIIYEKWMIANINNGLITFNNIIKDFEAELF